MNGTSKILIIIIAQYSTQAHTDQLSFWKEVAFKRFSMGKNLSAYHASFIAMCDHNVYHAFVRMTPVKIMLKYSIPAKYLNID